MLFTRFVSPREDCPVEVQFFGLASFYVVLGEGRGRGFGQCFFLARVWNFEDEEATFPLEVFSCVFLCSNILSILNPTW
jgi:hypothetical protein